MKIIYTIPKLLALLCMVMTIASSAMAQKTVSAHFLYFQPSPRANAMGGTAIAMEQSSFESYSNPALLGFTQKFSVAASWQNPLPLFDRSHFFGTASYLFDNKQALNISANLYANGTNSRTFDNGSLGAKYTLGHSLLTATYARTLNNNLSIGAGISYLAVNLISINVTSPASGKARSLLFNLGMFYRNILPETTYNSSDTSTNTIDETYNHQGISIGLAFANIGPKLTFREANESSNPPSTMTIGAAWSPLRTQTEGLQLALDLEKRIYENGFINRIHTGIELNFLRFICLRGGYNIGTVDAQNSYLTLGGGVRLPFLQINVARYTKTLLPTWQFSTSFIVN